MQKGTRNYTGTSRSERNVGPRTTEGGSANSGRPAARPQTGKKERPAGREDSGREKACPEKREVNLCPHFRKCGSCKYLHLPYEEQLTIKRNFVRSLMDKHCSVKPAIGMENPFHYRRKVHAVFGLDKKKNPISGIYEEKSHRVVSVDACLIEDEKADAVIATIRGMLKSFKIKTYDEDTGYGLLRYVLIRRGFFTEELMVVLVTASPVFPSKRNFVGALLKAHPEITTVVQNINTRTDSLVLGEKNQVLYGKGYIEDTLCGCRFKISPSSFYQVNPEMAEKLYDRAVGLAGLTGKETVIDAYCGTGTIGILAAKKAGKVIGVENNPAAVRDAVTNAKMNQIENIRFYKDDAGHFLTSAAADGLSVDVVLMDPPRAGASEEFLKSLCALRPEKIVYVSCNPVTMERDVGILAQNGYRAREVWPVDMFPWTTAIEAVALLTLKGDAAGKSER